MGEQMDKPLPLVAMSGAQERQGIEQAEVLQGMNLSD
jgi:hypothetical protein